MPDVSEAEFQKAADWIGSLPKDGPVQATSDEKLIAYGFFKQVRRETDQCVWVESIVYSLSTGYYYKLSYT